MRRWQSKQKNGGTNPKNGREKRRNIGSVRGGKKKGWELNRLQVRVGGGDEEVTKKEERSKHKFKSLKENRVKMSTSICF